MEFEHTYDTCRWCSNFRNGHCEMCPMHAEPESVEMNMNTIIEDGEVSDLLSETMPHHINNLIEKLVPDLPTKWKKAISQALMDSNNSDYWDMADSIESWLMRIAKQMDNSADSTVYISDPEEFRCKYFR